jgi:putative ABC transport system permease protein
MGDNGQFTVLGVVADVKENNVYSEIKPQAYYPLPVALDEPGFSMNIALRSAGSMKALPGALREKIHSLDSSLALSHFRTMKDVISDSITGAGTDYVTILLGIFGLLALALTVVGIYGVMAYTVSQRRREFGIRIALGAQRSKVLAMVIVQGAKLTLAGVALGLAGAFALTRVMARLVFGVSTTDPLTFTAAAGLLTAVALCACYVPARRATKVDPMVALRYE